TSSRGGGRPSSPRFPSAPNCATWTRSSTWSAADPGLAASGLAVSRAECVRGWRHRARGQAAGRGPLGVGDGRVAAGDLLAVLDVGPDGEPIPAGRAVHTTNVDRQWPA